ncbi:MAG: hypothetical protein AB7T06_29280 [Kofleriaceae bacterium]
MPVAVNLRVQKRVMTPKTAEELQERMRARRERLVADIGDEVNRFVRDRYRTRTDPWGNAWAPPLEDTLRRREGLPNIQAIARLVYVRFEEAGRRVVVGARHRAARFLSDGVPGKHLPARKALPIVNGEFRPPAPLLRKIRRQLELLARGE